jgi:tryptophanyl-tRNA synthetase
VKPRVVSGMRPTGKLHLGHLAGALRNWVSLQIQYDCFYFVADWHALTSEYANTSELAGNATDNLADWIAAGIDPEKSTIFIQSLVPSTPSSTFCCRWWCRSRGSSGCRRTKSSRRT